MNRFAEHPEGRFSFRPCCCGSQRIHGCFHNPEGVNISKTFFDPNEALEWLRPLFGEKIPFTEQEIIETETRQTYQMR